MAQVMTGRIRRLAERYGLIGRALAAIVCIALIAVVVGVAWTLGVGARTFSIERAEETSDFIELEDDASSSNVEVSTEKQELIVVHVDGCVVTPGVYALEAGSRVNDAVIAAGGLTTDAETKVMNFAELLVDGEKVYVPAVGEDVAEVTSITTNTTTSTSTSTLVNINTATSEELCTLPGIGEATAATIIQDRQDNGPFTSIEDIMRVSGIGEKKFAKIEGLICV